METHKSATSERADSYESHSPETVESAPERTSETFWWSDR